MTLITISRNSSLLPIEKEIDLQHGHVLKRLLNACKDSRLGFLASKVKRNGPPSVKRAQLEHPRPIKSCCLALDCRGLSLVHSLFLCMETDRQKQAAIALLDSVSLFTFLESLCL